MLSVAVCCAFQYEAKKIVARCLSSGIFNYVFETNLNTNSGERRIRTVFQSNCIRPTHETLFADVPNLSIENATNMSKDRKLLSSHRALTALPNLYKGELQ